jgi:hypothetical protein
MLSPSASTLARLVRIVDTTVFGELPFRDCPESPTHGRDGGLLCALWRAGDTPRICPTTNGVASVRICRIRPHLPGPTGQGRPRLHGWAEVDAAGGIRVLPRRQVVEGTFAWNLPQPEDGQRLREVVWYWGGLFVYAAMTRLMVRRLARAKQFSDTISRQSRE